MNKTNIYSLAMDALVDLAPEIAAVDRTITLPTTSPSLEEILSEISPLPSEALFLGVAEDGLPVLLNLHDSVPGPLLICADKGSGKTGFLHFIAKALIKLHNPEDVQFGVITANPEEWRGYEKSTHCVGIFPFHQNSGEDFILSLGSWAHVNNSRQSVVLLLDDLIHMEDASPEVQDTLRWLLLRGPARHVWPIASLNPSQIEKSLPWLDLFRTRIYGAIKEENLAQSITRSADTSLSLLIPGTQFTMREGRSWLRFWIPHLEEGESNEPRNALV